MIHIYIKLFQRLILLLPIYFFIRVIFYFYNINIYKNFSFSEVFIPLLYGFRFDIATIFLSNLIFILVSLFLVNQERVKKTIFFLINLSFLVFLIVDLELFQFLGKKMTFDIFYLGDDIWGQGFQLIFYYWKLLLLYLFLSITLFKFYPSRKIEKISFKKTFSLKHLLSSFLILVISFFCLRGGFQSRSIGAKEAFVFQGHELGNLVLNPVYTLLRSALKKPEKKVEYFKTDDEVIEIIKKKIPFVSRKFDHSKKQNIIILILESFSYEYLENGYTPFLKTLERKSLFYKGFAGGRRSIEALPSILLGVPSVAKVALSQSAFQGNKFLSFTHYTNNYNSSFYHGGKNGTMGFDSFTRSIGFANYLGKNEYPNTEHFDGNWGIFDHHYLNYFSKELDKKHNPFFSVLFTLSSHQPYTIPKGFKGHFKKGKLEIHETIGYVDDALKNFFKTNQNKEWFKNTLFIITADHTQKLESNKTELDLYRVPIIFYHPNMDLKQYQKKRIVSQSDILPSILDFLDIEPSKKILLGNSIFSNDKGFFFARSNESFLLYPEDKILKRALEQYFINGLIRNDIYK